MITKGGKMDYRITSPKALTTKEKSDRHVENVIEKIAHDYAIGTGNIQ